MTSITRRSACRLLGTAGGALLIPSRNSAETGKTPVITGKQIEAIDRQRILRAADSFLAEAPVTVTAASSPRSPGGAHDFYSEGDYWWPDPKNPGGPYIRRDGESNPENFNKHREALFRLSVQVPALTAAWLITKDARYAEHAGAHLQAWFVTPTTRMNPNLEHAQAIFGVNTGRGTGIIDTIHLTEVAQSAALLCDAGKVAGKAADGLRGWFKEYVSWLTTSKNGIEERDATNNHGSCWVMQTAAFARFTGDTGVLELCRERFRTNLIPKQVAANGSLPLELARTKPYSYSLFDMDILATTCHMLSMGGTDLWRAKTPTGQTLHDTVAFYEPFIANKAAWPFAHDVEYFDDLPVRQPSLLFAGIAYREPGWIALWKTLNPDPTVPEVIRDFPIRQPVLWTQHLEA